MFSLFPPCRYIAYARWRLALRYAPYDAYASYAMSVYGISSRCCCKMLDAMTLFAVYDYLRFLRYAVTIDATLRVAWLYAHMLTPCLLLCCCCRALRAMPCCL